MSKWIYYFDSKRQKAKWGMDRRSTHRHIINEISCPAEAILDYTDQRSGSA